MSVYACLKPIFHLTQLMNLLKFKLWSEVTYINTFGYDKYLIGGGGF